MKFASKIVALVAISAALALAPTVARRAQAADAQAVVAEIEAHNKAFLAAYENGQVGKMKSEVKKAVSLGEKNGLTNDPVMADTYVLAGILEVDVNENTAAGVKDFQKALKIKPDVTIPKGMATSPVKLALKQAKEASGEAPKEAAAPAPAEKETAKTAEPAKAGAEEEKAEKAEKASDKTTDKAAQKESDKAEKARADAEAKEREKQEKAEREEQARQDKVDKAERQKAEAALAKDKAAQDKQLADVRTRSQQLEKDKADREKQLADAKTRGQQLEKDKAAQDKQLADANKQVADANKQLADAKARITQLEKDKADANKQLADAKARIAQLEKDKGDKDKQLADAKAREAKEREGREKIEREHQAAEAAARDAEAKKKAEQENRARLFAGPEMPPQIREQVHCEVPDEAPLRTDLFVHCIAKPSLKARTIVFYYRAGSAHYYSVPMERTAKGWYAAIVPGVRVIGKSMQYYAEALDGREAVVGRNGKESSPNILTLKPSAPRG